MKNDEIKNINLCNWPLDESILAELGRISALWSILEQTMNLCIGKLAGFDVMGDPKSYILVNHSSFPQKLDMIEALCNEMADAYPHLKPHKLAIGKLNTAKNLRNQYLHNVINVNSDTGQMEIAIGSARGKLKVGTKKIAKEDIRQASVAIHDAQRELWKLIFRREIKPVWETRNKK